MDPKNSKIFSKDMMQTVSAFCDAQEIKDVDNFIYLCFKKGFDIRKYGLLGKTLNEGEKDLIKEVIVEKRVEIPVEVIKEVEKIVEVPVDRIVEIIKEVEKIVEVTKEIPVEKVVIHEVIKEVPIERVVEKEIYITDDTQVNELLLKIQELENGMSKKNEELDELRQEISTKTTEIGTISEEFSTKTTENESFFQNEISKKNEELDELRRTLDELNNNDKSKLLQETLQNLRGELQQKNEQIRELEKINRDLLNGNQNNAYLLRGSNLNRRI
jgi:chromosome segregation ATPase